MVARHRWSTGIKPCGWPVSMPTVPRLEARIGLYSRATRDRSMAVHLDPVHVR